MARHRSGASSGRRARTLPALPSSSSPAPSASGARHRHDPATTPLDLAAIATAAAAARSRTHGAAGSTLTRRHSPAPADAAKGTFGQSDRPEAPFALPAQHPSAPLPAQHSSAPAAQHPSAPLPAQHPSAPLPAQHPSAPLPAQHPSAPAAQHPSTPLPALHPSSPLPAQAPEGRTTHRAGGASVGAALGRAVSPTRAAGALALLGALAGAGVAAASGGSTYAADPPADTGSIPRADPSSATEPAPAGVVTRVESRPPATSAPAPRTASTRPSAPDAPRVPAPAVRPVDDGKTLWSADFARAGLANFKSTPWNNEGAKAPSLAGGALDFTMPGGGKRSEVEPDFRDLREGDEYYFGFTVRLAPDFPTNTSDWQVITQFKNDGTGSPPLELKVQDGKFLLDGDSGGFSRVVGDAVPGRSTHLALRVRFSSSDGSVSAWQDGVQKIADFRPPSGTMYAGRSSYVKTGIYRDTSIDQPGRLSFTSWAIGTSLGAVGRDAAPPRD